MGSGHASHKGSSEKPNTNANQQLDTAADLSLNQDDPVPESFDAVRAEETEVNPAAIQRPSNDAGTQHQ